MRKIIIILLILFISFLVSGRDIYSNRTNVKIYINTGFHFNFPITTDYSYREKFLFLDIPLSLGLDFRFHERFSLYTGLDFIYGIISYKQTIDNNPYSFYIHNFFVRIPFVVKFYPLIHLNEAYNNFYLGVGGFIHSWILNSYYVIAKNNVIHTGNSYNPVHNELPPWNVYTPINIGFKFSIGNHFSVSNRFLLGLEFFLDYMFIPYINGYYFGQNYRYEENVIVEFNGSVGGLISFGIDLL